MRCREVFRFLAIALLVTALASVRVHAIDSPTSIYYTIETIKDGFRVVIHDAKGGDVAMEVKLPKAVEGVKPVMPNFASVERGTDRFTVSPRPLNEDEGGDAPLRADPKTLLVILNNKQVIPHEDNSLRKKTTPKNEEKSKGEMSANLVRGMAYLQGRKFDEAIAELDKAIEADPKNPLAFNERGVAYSWKAKYDEAINDYTKAILLDANYALAFRNRGSSFYHRGDYDLAIGDFSAAIRLEPDNAKAYWRRSQVYAKKGETAKAEEDRKKALSLDPSLK